MCSRCWRVRGLCSVKGHQCQGTPDRPPRQEVVCILPRLACSTDCTSAPAALRLLASALGGGTGWEGREGPWCRARRAKPFPNHPGHSVGSFVARLRPMPPPRALGSRIEFAEQKGARDRHIHAGRTRARPDLDAARTAHDVHAHVHVMCTCARTCTAALGLSACICAFIPQDGLSPSLCA